ncbi:MAG: hypothetical protein HYY01_07810 [Chloroflexi bacterium]|nr:hypothetical protein [Chloroflexota bacterium]
MGVEKRSPMDDDKEFYLKMDAEALAELKKELEEQERRRREEKEKREKQDG